MAITQYPDPLDKFQICTSSTRPTSPFEGMMIYETDTDIIYWYSGTSWVARVATTLQQSTVYQSAPAGNDDLTAAAMADWGSTIGTVAIPSWATVTMVVVSINGAYPVSAAGGYQFRIVLDGVAGRTMTGLPGQDFTNNPRASMSWTDTFTGFSTGSSKTLKMQGFRSSGTGAMRVDTASDFTYYVTFSSA